jgi:biotin operon repressor
VDDNLKYQADTKTLIGTKTRSLVDLETGEQIEVQQIVKRVYGQKMFWKVYLLDFLQVLGVLDSKQVDVFIYVLQNTEPSNNTFIGSQRKIAEKTGVSLDTVSKIMGKLQKVGFIKQVQRGVYQISANVMMRGSDYKKQLLLSYYDEERQK